MAYRLRPSRPFTAEFRSVAGGQLKKAIGYLEEQPDGPHEAIHDARKRFKRVRALLRLIQKDAPEFRATENARIRDTARSLSVVRDATALVETIDYLLANATSSGETEALQATRDVLTARRDRIAEEEHDLPAKMAAAVDACREAIGALDALDLADAPAKTAKHLARAWKKLLGKAKGALAQCETAPEAEAFHDLRKHGQTYWMHLSLLRDIWPTAMQAKQRECKALVDLLGHEHDLSVLTQMVNEEPELIGDSETLARVLAAIITRQQILRQEALPMAKAVFAEEPATEADMIALLWLRAASEKSARPVKPLKQTALHG